MEPPEYALLLERLCVASDDRDWLTFETLLPLTQQAHARYNVQRIAQGKDPIVIHPESWQILSRKAHEYLWN
jgi:hypothetical protein